MAKKIKNEQATAQATVETVAQTQATQDTAPQEQAQPTAYELAQATVETMSPLKDEYIKARKLIWNTDHPNDSSDTVVEILNKESFDFIKALTVADTVIDWRYLANRPTYPQIDTTGETHRKTLTVNDIFTLKPNSKSIKQALPKDLELSLCAMAVNLRNSKDADADSLGMLKVYTKFIPALNCFVDHINEQGQEIKASDTAQLVKQFVEISKMLNMPIEIIDKATDKAGYNKQDKYIRQIISLIKDDYIKAQAERVTDGTVKKLAGRTQAGEIKLLDTLLKWTRTAHLNHNLENTSKAQAHKEPKAKK